MNEFKRKHNSYTIAKTTLRLKAMFKGNERKKVQNKDIIKHDGKTILNGTSVRR